jgi:hypothetical protein
MPVDADAFLARHVETFNAAVASGDFAPLVALFADDAELAFPGLPIGPFRGRQAIADAYRAQPPTDTMTVRDTRVEPDGALVEGFSWAADGERRSGEMRLELRGDLIARLEVTFSAPSG